MNIGPKPVVLVTGASSGMGKDFALRLISEGYVVYGAARRVERMSDIAAAVSNRPDHGPMGAFCA